MILDKCSLWRKLPEHGGLSDEEKMQTLDAVTAPSRLPNCAFRRGRTSDAEMLAELPYLSRYPTGLIYDLGDLTDNR